MDSLYLVMPAYNEEENIEEVVRAWYPLLDGKGEASRMVVADSGSTDGTHRILETLQEEFPKLEILSDTGKQHGPKVIALYDYAIKNGADYIFQTDSDGQTNPAEFARFWNLRGRYAAIFGLRKERGDGKIRAFVERVVCLLLGLYFRVIVPDANAPFRLMRADAVKKYLYRMAPDYNLPNIMLTTFFAYYHEKIRFRKITFRPRQAGTNSVNVKKIVQIGWKALGDFRAFRKDMLAEEKAASGAAAYPELADDEPDAPSVAEREPQTADVTEREPETDAPTVAEHEPDAPTVTEREPRTASVMEPETQTDTADVTEREPETDAPTVEKPEPEAAPVSESEPEAADGKTVNLEKPERKES